MDTKSKTVARFSLPVYLILVPLISYAIPLLLSISPVIAVLFMLIIPALAAILLTATVEVR